MLSIEQKEIEVKNISLLVFTYKKKPYMKSAATVIFQIIFFCILRFLAMDIYLTVS